MNLQSKLVRAFASTALFASFAALTVACGAPSDSASNDVDSVNGVGIDESNNGDPTAFSHGPIACLSETIPGFDDPGAHLMGCGGGGGGGPIRPPPRPKPPAATPVPGSNTCPGSNPDPLNYTEVVNPCHWDHHGVSSKDGEWLKARAIENCLPQLQAQIDAQWSGGGSATCKEVTAFVVAGTNSKKSWDGKRSFTASGDITLHAFVGSPFVPCNGPNPPSFCQLDGSYNFASAVSFSD